MRAALLEHQVFQQEHIIALAGRELDKPMSRPIFTPIQQPSVDQARD
jgi:hypothetical protein